jgi:hypothetical protein
LFGVGVHRHRTFPLGVEKRQGIREEFGPLHAKRAIVPDAPDATAGVGPGARLTAANKQASQTAAQTASSAAERPLPAGEIATVGILI